MAVVQPLLHREVLGVPMSTLKYAMTLDGKIATHTGHSAWVSNASSRQRVFEQRAASDAVIVGGNTVRRDNPRLTTRRERGHFPTRIIMTRCLDLPAVRLGPTRRGGPAPLSPPPLTGTASLALDLLSVVHLWLSFSFAHVTGALSQATGAACWCRSCVRVCIVLYALGTS